MTTQRVDAQTNSDTHNLHTNTLATMQDTLPTTTQLFTHFTYQIEYTHVPDIHTRLDKHELSSQLPEAEYNHRVFEYQKGYWHYIGIYATAHLTGHTIHNGWQRIGQIQSSGLFGIEDDSEPHYIHEVEQEQKQELLQILNQFCPQATEEQPNPTQKTPHTT